MVKKNEKESPRALNEEDLESVTAVVVVVATVKEESMKANRRTELQSFSNRNSREFSREFILEGVSEPVPWQVINHVNQRSQQASP